MDKKNVKHTLRMTEAESRKLKHRAEKTGISQAEYVRQKVFGFEPAPMPENPFWEHMAALYAIHDRIKDSAIRAELRQLILQIQTEATAPRKVVKHGDDKAVAH